MKIKPVRYQIEHNGKTITFEIQGKRLNVFALDLPNGDIREFIFQGSKPEMVEDIGAMLQKLGQWAGEKIETQDILKEDTSEEV